MNNRLKSDPAVQRKNAHHSGRLSPPPAAQAAGGPPSPDANRSGPSISRQRGVPEPAHPTTRAAAGIFPPQLTELVTGMTKVFNKQAEGGITMQERHEALQMAERILKMEGIPDEAKENASRVVTALSTNLVATFTF